MMAHTEREPTRAEYLEAAALWWRNASTAAGRIQRGEDVSINRRWLQVCVRGFRRACAGAGVTA